MNRWKKTTSTAIKSAYQNQSQESVFGDGFPPNKNSEPLAFYTPKEKLTAKAPKKTPKGKSSEPILVVQVRTVSFAECK